MTRTFTGGCQCGAVRYELLEKPTGAHLCHCRMCQKQFGNFFAPLASVSRSKFKVTRGHVTNFRSSEHVQRGFCEKCGTPLTFDPLDEDITAFAIPTLDDYSDVIPLNQYGIEARHGWVTHLLETPAYDSGQDVNGPSHMTAKLPGIAATNRQHPDHDTKTWPPKG